MAYHERRIDDINRAKEILALAEQGAKDEDAIAAKYGGMEVLNEILGQLRGDAIVATNPQSEPVAQAAKSTASSPAVVETKPTEPSSASLEIKPIPPVPTLSAQESLPDLALVKSNGHGKTDPI